MFFVEELLSITMKLLKKLIILIALVIVYVFLYIVLKMKQELQMLRLS